MTKYRDKSVLRRVAKKLCSLANTCPYIDEVECCKCLHYFGLYIESALEKHDGIAK